MNILQFITGCDGYTGDDPCKDEKLGDAMPLFKIPPIEERIAAYQEILSDPLSLGMVQRTHRDYGDWWEYQFVLQLSSLNDPAKEAERRKLYAFTSGLLNFYNADNLRQAGWDVEALFGAGRPDAEIGALKLVPLYREGWTNYYPQTAHLNLAVYCFNIRVDLLQTYIKPLIECYVSYEFAEAVLKNYGIQVTPADDWIEQYYQLFLIQPDVKIQLSAGSEIGEIDLHVQGSAEKIYRLSMFFVENNVLEFDFSPHLETFMRYRGRVPPVRGEGITDSTAGSMAGHPMIVKLLNIPPEAARVDLVDQTRFSENKPAFLPLDLDQDPPVFIIRRPPSPEQAQILDSIGTTQEARERHALSLYNPDGQFLKVGVVDDNGPVEGFRIEPDRVHASEKAVAINVTPPAGAPPARLQVVQTEGTFTADMAVVLEIPLVYLPCKLFPVKLWRLQDSFNSYRPGVMDQDFLLRTFNTILGEQSNVYLFPDGSTQTVELAGRGLPTQAEYNVASNLLITPILDSLRELSSRECNILFSWELTGVDAHGEKQDTLGVTIPANWPEKYLYPIIMLEIVDRHNDDYRAQVLVHEIGHWFWLRFGLEAGESQHFDHDENNKVGHDEYRFNIMFRYAEESFVQLTLEQARIINQYAGTIGGALSGPD